jgi:xanthine dehydrogenase accessory factor
VVAEDFDLTDVPIGPNTFVVIATQHKNDHVWLQKALEKDAAYVALIASHHRARLVLEYLAAEGFPREKLARICSPAGLDIGATTPEEIALSIMSQIVALRRGGSTEALSTKKSDLSVSSQTEDKVVTHCETDRPT